MASYFTHLRRHGPKLYFSFFLGTGISMILLLGILWLLARFTFLNGDTESFYLIFSTDSDLVAEALVDLFANHLVGLIFFLLMAPIFILLSSSFNSAGIYNSLHQAVFENRSSVGSYFSGGIKYFGKMFGQTLLIALMTSPLFFLFTILSSFLIGILGDEGAILSFALIIILSIPLLLLISLGFLHAPVILVSEQVGIWKSIAYSWKLLFKKFGQVFLSVLLVGGISFIVWIPFAIVNGVITLLLGEISGAIVTDLTQFFISPLVILITLLLIFTRYKQKLRPVLLPSEAAGEAYEEAKIVPPTFLEKAEKVEPQATPAPPQSITPKPPKSQDQILPQEEKPVTPKPEPPQPQEAKPKPTPSIAPATPKGEGPPTAFPTFTYPDEEKPPR